jgi:hypothetical protein
MSSGCPGFPLFASLCLLRNAAAGLSMPERAIQAVLPPMDRQPKATRLAATFDELAPIGCAFLLTAICQVNAHRPPVSYNATWGPQEET